MDVHSFSELLLRLSWYINLCEYYLRHGLRERADYYIARYVIIAIIEIIDKLCRNPDTYEFLKRICVELEAFREVGTKLKHAMYSVIGDKEVLSILSTMYKALRGIHGEDQSWR